MPLDGQNKLVESWAWDGWINGPRRLKLSHTFKRFAQIVQRNKRVFPDTIQEIYLRLTNNSYFTKENYI
jgi:hypothetical protein